jgi:hypothetical protein
VIRGNGEGGQLGIVARKLRGTDSDVGSTPTGVDPGM